MKWKNTLKKSEARNKKLKEIETQLGILLEEIKIDPSDWKNQDKVMNRLKEIKEDYEELVRVLEEEPDEVIHKPTYDEMQEDITQDELNIDFSQLG